MIRVDHAHVRIAARSDPGRSGKNNEDRFSVTAYQLSPIDPTPSLLAIVADGIGGHLAGEVAAEMAVNTITRVVSDGDASHPVDVLKSAIVQASQAIQEQSDSQLGQRGMGATCACVWLIGDHLYTASVGDSRIYLARGDSLQQLTIDHTWVQEAVDHGALTPEQARHHPNAHVIRRYLGSKHPVLPDTRMRLQSGESDLQSERNQGLRLKPGDRLLLCSDGLTDLVEDFEILRALQARDLEAVVEYLVDLANYRGGWDNITAVIIELPGGERTALRNQLIRFVALSCLGLIILAGIAAVTALLLMTYFRAPSALLPLFQALVP